MKYTDCVHNWKLLYDGHSPFAVECEVCHLAVMGFRDHVSLYGVTKSGLSNFLGSMHYPNPEDEEATELEPEEVTADAEGGVEG